MALSHRHIKIYKYFVVVVVVVNFFQNQSFGEKLGVTASTHLLPLVITRA